MAIISSRPNLAQSTEPASQTPNHSQHPEQVAESTPNSAHLDELVDKKIREAMMRPPSQPTPSSTSPAITCPLSDHILEAPLPSHFRMPHIEAYDGSSDPLDHLHTFQDLMLLQGASDPILCRAFPATFRKAARVWYSKLPSQSITTFPQFAKQFTTHFANSRKPRKTAINLMYLTQQQDESLRSFIGRFHEELLDIPDLPTSSAVVSLIQNTRNHHFKISLSKKPPASMTELLERAEKYINAEETMKVARAATDHPQGEKRKKQPELSHHESKRYAVDRSQPTVPLGQVSRGYDRTKKEYTPLNTPLSTILMEVRSSGVLRNPPPMIAPPSHRNMNQYCQFHRNYGHSTDQCRSLENEVESLIRRGYLGKFVGRKGTRE